MTLINCVNSILNPTALGKHGHKVATFGKDIHWTYTELHQIVNRIGNCLMEAYKIVPGDIIVFQGFSSPWLLAIWLAALKIGATSCLIPNTLTQDELKSVLNQLNTKLLIADANYHTNDITALFLNTVYFNKLTDKSLDIMQKAFSNSLNAVLLDKHTTAIIAFTSGSTGKPKACLHSHQNLIAASQIFPKNILKLTMDDICCGTPPLAFTYGLGGLVLFPIAIQASTLLLDKLSPESLLHAIEQYKATICFSSPIGYSKMLKNLEKYDTSSLRICVSAGAPLAESIAQQWKEKTGITLIDGLGSTEMLHIYISATSEEKKPGYIGKLLPGYETQLINAQERICNANEPGVLYIKGPTNCQYLHSINDTHHEWINTKDICIQEKDGYYKFLSRADDIIIYNGFNVSPVEIENILLELLGIDSCVVIGLKDTQTCNEEICAILPKNSTDITIEILEKLKTSLSFYKMPKYFYKIDIFPQTSTGKIDRNAVKEWAKNQKST